MWNEEWIGVVWNEEWLGVVWQNAVTHKSANRKKEIIVDWEPSPGTTGKIRFR